MNASSGPGGGSARIGTWANASVTTALVVVVVGLSGGPAARAIA